MVPMVFRWFGRKDGNAAPVSRARAAPQPDRVYRPGDFIGGEWRVLRAMEGGLGLVYAVEHRESGDRRVLKAPKRQFDAAVRESFRAEAETWVRLGDHPNIVCAQGVDEFGVKPTLGPRVPASVMTTAYEQWCAGRGLEPVSGNMFGVWYLDATLVDGFANLALGETRQRELGPPNN
jgi:hypothetical protein